MTSATRCQSQLLRSWRIFAVGGIQLARRQSWHASLSKMNLQCLNGAIIACWHGDVQVIYLSWTVFWWLPSVCIHGATKSKWPACGLLFLGLPCKPCVCQFDGDWSPKLFTAHHSLVSFYGDWWDQQFCFSLQTNKQHPWTSAKRSVCRPSFLTTT